MSAEQGRVGTRTSFAVGFLLIGLGATACGPRCDLKALQTEWGAIGDSPSIDETLSLLGRTCPTAPAALLNAVEQSDLENLHAVIACVGPDESMSSKGDATHLSVREALWTECKDESAALGSQREFLWSAGRPDIALALSRFLGEKKVSAETVDAMVKVAMSSPVLPVDADFDPLVWGKGAKATLEPATERLATDAGKRVAATKSDSFATLAANVQAQGEVTLVGLSADGLGFAERSVLLDKEVAVALDDTLSVWVLPGKGISLFDGERVLGTSESCSEYSICESKDTGLDMKALAEVASTSTAKAGIRLGLVDGDLPLSTVAQIVDAVVGESALAIKLSTIPEIADSERELTATVRWIAGMSDESGLLNPGLRKSKVWKRHKKWMDEKWESYDKRHLSVIREWMPKNLADLTDLPLFYPFSGPDILNAVTFFPGQELYVMGGLEDIGEFPKAPDVLGETGAKGLEALRQGLHNYLATNYFITWQMLGTHIYEHYTRLGEYAYNGASSLMMVFLVRTGHEIISIRRVTLDDSGAVVDAKNLTERPRAVEIRFREISAVTPNPKPEQKLIFFSGDLSDRAFSQTRGLLAYVESVGQYNTFLKAASYLLHSKKFDDVRSAILNRSRHLIMEASGVPYHFLKNDTENWSVRVYGAYRGPIEPFPERCQPDLIDAVTTSKNGALPFRFGYDRRNFHMIVGERKTPIAPTKVDGDKGRGTDTVFIREGKSCTKGEHRILVK